MGAPNRTVVIDFLPESVARYRDRAIVAVDVIRASSTLATGKALGRRCFVAPTLERALAQAQSLDNPLLVGEVGGDMPPAFHINNSPAALAMRTDVERPMILLSSSGTRVMHEARNCAAAYVACFRNFATAASHIAERHAHVAVIGAGTRGEFREEDQMCCAWVAELLIEAGYAPRDERTAAMVKHWHGVAPDACRVSKSALYLERTNQVHDLDFILAHVNDLSTTLALKGNEVVYA